jgi:hypothetical protein
LSGQPQGNGPLFSFIPGTFYSAPIASNGFLWALSADGVVYRLSPQASAKAVSWCQIPSKQAGVNRIVAVDVQVPGGDLMGPVLLAADATRVYAISLVQRGVVVSLKHSSAGEIVANVSSEDSQSFRAIAAEPDFFCFLFQPPDSSETRLVVRYFQKDRAIEEPLRLSGRAFIGPVAFQGAVGVCGQDEVWVYSTLDQQVRSFPLPSGFEPYFQRPSRGVNVPPGQMSFAIQKVDGGWEAWIGGEFRGKPHILAVHVDGGRHEFHELTEKACICTAVPGGLGVNQVSSAAFFGLPRPAGRFGALQPGMPVARDGTSFCYFRHSESAGSHELALHTEGMEPLTLSFEDPQCNEDSCCTMHWMGRNLLVSYMQLAPADGASRGLKFAHWSVE